MTNVETEMNDISTLKHNNQNENMVIEDACEDSLGAIEADSV